MNSKEMGEKLAEVHIKSIQALQMELDSIRAKEADMRKFLNCQVKISKQSCETCPAEYQEWYNRYLSGVLACKLAFDKRFPEQK